MFTVSLFDIIRECMHTEKVTIFGNDGPDIVSSRPL